MKIKSIAAVGALGVGLGVASFIGAGPPRFYSNEVLHLEDSQRFANSGAAHLRLFYQLALRRQWGTLGELAIEDPLPQLASKHIGSLGNVDRAQPDTGPRGSGRRTCCFHWLPLMVYGLT